MSNETKAIARELKTQVTILGGTVAFLWAIEIIDQAVFRNQLNFYGIHPRTMWGLRGILFAPFLHGSLAHLLSNTIPFLIMGWLVMVREIRDFFAVSAIAAITSGLGVWLFGLPGTVHIGASGVVFGYFGYLLFRGYFERSFASIVLSLTVGLLYGGLIWGVLPVRYGISWEGHLFGFIGGILAARMLAERRPRSL